METWTCISTIVDGKVEVSIDPNPSPILLSPQNPNAAPQASPVESQLPHMAAFMLAREDNWYYFGSTGWWDDDFVWNPLFDRASGCGRPTEPPPAPGSGPVFRRKYERCAVSIDCTNSTACVGDISFT